MATLAPQKIPDETKAWLEREAKKSGESIAFVVRRELLKARKGK